MNPEEIEGGTDASARRRREDQRHVKHAGEDARTIDAARHRAGKSEGAVGGSRTTGGPTEGGRRKPAPRKRRRG